MEILIFVLSSAQESSHSDNVGIYIISGEVLETARRHGAETPLPYIAGELAVRLLSVIIDPLHALYAKANKFLNKGPCWEIGKIPSYWIDKILYNEPEYDNAHKDELSWLLGLFVHGLRTNKVRAQIGFTLFHLLIYIYIYIYTDMAIIRDRTWTYTDGRMCLSVFSLSTMPPTPSTLTGGKFSTSSIGHARSMAGTRRRFSRDLVY